MAKKSKKAVKMDQSLIPVLILGVLAIVAACMMFMDAISVPSDIESLSYNINGLKVIFGGEYRNGLTSQACFGTIVAVFLPFVCVLVYGLLHRMTRKALLLPLVGFTVSAVLFFCFVPLFMGANAGSVGILASASLYKLSAGPIIGGIVSVLGALSSGFFLIRG